MPAEPVRAQLVHHPVAPERRDDALARVGRMTRASAAAAAVALATLGVYVARAIPGHAAHSPSTSTAGSPAPRAGSRAAPATGTPVGGGLGASGGITPSTVPPARTTNPPVVTSGAS